MDNKAFDKEKIRGNLLTTLALLTGCCGLAYEVLYVRALTSILGDMFYVHAALLSTFLAGIGLGAKLAHKWLRWLWIFEVFTGLYALGLPVISKWFSQLPVMSQVTSSAALTIFVTVCFISIPSLLIGFSIPLFSAYIKAYRPEHLSFQGVYKVYNLGAFLSVLGVELILIRKFGISLSLAVIGAINLFNGVVLLLMKAAPTSSRPSEKPRQFLRRSTIALALASFGSAVFQMFFLKLSYLVFYPHRENFAIGLSVTMLGIFLGSWLVIKTKIRFESCLVLAAVIIGIIYVNYIPILKFYEATVPWARSSELLVFVHKFAFGCLFALGPMILFGALIPALMRSENEVAGESGHLLWISSLANATGYLIYVLIAHPLLTSAALLAAIAGIMVLASLLSAGFRWLKAERVLAVVSIVLIVFLMFTWQERNFHLAHWVNELKPSDEVRIYKSGAESASLVCAKKDDKIWEDVWITYNGHPSITVQRNGIVNYAEMVVGIIPGITAPSLDRALVIGLGTGVTAGATSQLFKTTDVVEINKAFYEMMPALSYSNLDIEQNSLAKLHLSDGRAFLVGKEQTYDAILSTVSAPTYFTASKIYTLDFYKRVSESLKAGGVFSTWVSSADMSKEGIMVILSALRHSFKYCELRLLRGNYYLLTCSNQPIIPRRKLSEMVPAEDRLTRQLQAALSDVELDEFFVDMRLSENIFDHFVPHVSRENTDDRPVLEFMVARCYQMKQMGSDPFTERQELFNIDPVRRTKSMNPARLSRRAAVFYRLGPDYVKNFDPILFKEADVASEFFMHTAKYRTDFGDFDKAIQYLKTALKIRPDFAQAHNNLGTIFESQGKFDEAISHFSEAVKNKPDFFEAYENLANVFASQGKPDQAIKTLQQALAYNEIAMLKVQHNNQANYEINIASIHFNLGQVLKKLGQSEEAKGHFGKALEGYRKESAKNPKSLKTLVGLANTFGELHYFTEAEQVFRQIVNLDHYNLESHYALAKVLEIQGKYDQAITTLENASDFMMIQIGRKDAVNNLRERIEFLNFKRSKEGK